MEQKTEYLEIPDIGKNTVAYINQVMPEDNWDEDAEELKCKTTLLLKHARKKIDTLTDELVSSMDKWQTDKEKAEAMTREVNALTKTVLEQVSSIRSQIEENESKAGIVSEELKKTSLVMKNITSAMTNVQNVRSWEASMDTLRGALDSKKYRLVAEMVLICNTFDSKFPAKSHSLEDLRKKMNLLVDRVIKVTREKAKRLEEILTTQYTGVSCGVDMIDELNSVMILANSIGDVETAEMVSSLFLKRETGLNEWGGKCSSGSGERSDFVKRVNVNVSLFKNRMAEYQEQLKGKFALYGTMEKLLHTLLLEEFRLGLKTRKPTGPEFKNWIMCAKQFDKVGNYPLSASLENLFSIDEYLSPFLEKENEIAEFRAKVIFGAQKQKQQEQQRNLLAVDLHPTTTTLISIDEKACQDFILQMRASVDSCKEFSKGKILARLANDVWRKQMEWIGKTMSEMVAKFWNEVKRSVRMNKKGGQAETKEEEDEETRLCSLCRTCEYLSTISSGYMSEMEKIMEETHRKTLCETESLKKSFAATYRSSVHLMAKICVERMRSHFDRIVVTRWDAWKKVELHSPYVNDIICSLDSALMLPVQNEIPRARVQFSRVLSSLTMNCFAISVLNIRHVPVSDQAVQQLLVDCSTISDFLLGKCKSVKDPALLDAIKTQSGHVIGLLNVLSVPADIMLEKYTASSKYKQLKTKAKEGDEKSKNSLVNVFLKLLEKKGIVESETVDKMLKSI